MRSLSRRAQTDFGREARLVIQIDTEVHVLNSSSFNLAKIKDLSLLSRKKKHPQRLWSAAVVFL